MKLIITAIVSLIVGAAIAVFAYMSIVPLPNDAIARGEAFQPENQDWFYQNASEVFPTRTVARSEDGTSLPREEGVLDSFTYEYDGVTKTINDLFTDMETAGLIVLHDGAIIYEDYGRGADTGTRFTSFSLVKSFTSTLVGFAVGDGLIASVDDPLTAYIPELTGTAYDGVTVKHALQMASGIEFDPDQQTMQDTLDFITDSGITGKHTSFELAIDYPRKAEPGTVFNYNTAESQVLLELVRRVTGKTAAEYLEEKVWRPLGMTHDAGWIIDNPGPEGAEFGGAFFNAALRDWARFGVFVEQGGAWNGEQLLPADWVDRATVSDEPYLMHGKVHPMKNRGYAWHWWTYDNGGFTASGAYGQSLYINREQDLVVARASAWPEGWVKAYDEQTYAFYRALGEFLETQDVAAVSSSGDVETSLDAQ